MLASDSFLHFILDTDNDVHYTDTLVTLGPKAYIWYHLRRQNAAQNIVLLDIREDTQLRFDVFDSGSAQFLIPPARSIFPFGRSEQQPQTITHRDYTLQDVKLTEEELLSKLLSAASDQGNTALVLTHEAFERLCRSTNDRGKNQLRRLLSNPSPKCTLFIRLPQSAAQLEQLVNGGSDPCPLLDLAYARIRDAAACTEMPLLDALTVLLGSQLLRFDRSPDEARNLLLMCAASDSQAADTLKQLSDQADYLDLCRQHRTGLFAPSADTDPFTAVSRRKLGALVQNADFRQKLRRKTADLRSRHPHDTIENAMRQENQLPPLPAYPVYDDNLSRMAHGLMLPDDYLKDDPAEKAKWAAELEQIKHNLTILWNKPRNTAAIQAATEHCSNARAAILTSTWETLDITLRLLQFFSRQICAPVEQACALQNIQRYCREIVQLCNYLYGKRSFGLPTGFDQIIDKSLIAGNKAILEKLKFHVHSSIQRFEGHGITFSNISEELEGDRTRIVQEIAQANQALLDQREQEQALREEQELERRKHQLTSRYILDSGTELEPEDCAEMEIGDCTEDDLRSVNRLLKDHYLPLD